MMGNYCLKKQCLLLHFYEHVIEKINQAVIYDIHERYYIHLEVNEWT
jgi:hypothetical protein